MTRAELQQIAGSKLSDAELIARALDDSLYLRAPIPQATELIQECLHALKLTRDGR